MEFDLLDIQIHLQRTAHTLSPIAGNYEENVESDKNFKSQIGQLFLKK